LQSYHPVTLRKFNVRPDVKASVPVVLDATKFVMVVLANTVAPPALRLDVVILVADTLDNELTQLLINCRCNCRCS
jgi:hypothetical protein